MNYLRTLGLVLASGTALAACEQSPTSFDEGGTFGSGHVRSTSGAGGGAGSGQTEAQTETGTESTATTGGGEAASDSTLAERGGYTYGSGN